MGVDYFLHGGYIQLPISSEMKHMLTTGGKTRTYVIPGWIHRTLTRHSMSMMDIFDYTKIRRVVAQDDMASWVYINDIYKVRQSRLTYDNLVSLYDVIDDASRLEFSNISRIAEADYTAASVIERLSTVNIMSVTTAYQIVTIHDCVFVILNEGFLTHIEDLEALQDFIQQYLKAQYTIAPLADVSCTPLYPLYLELL
jgi:hypothetical protein